MRKALGRGLDALIPGAGRTTLPVQPVIPEQEHELPIAQIAPNPRQPRSEVDEAALTDLAASIRANGIIQPLLVRRKEGGGYELIAGERRLRAAERAGLRSVPVVVRSV